MTPRGPVKFVKRARAAHEAPRELSRFDGSKWLRADVAAVRLKISRVSLYRLVRGRKLAGAQLDLPTGGRLLYVPQAAVEARLEAWATIRGHGGVKKPRPGQDRAAEAH